MDFSTEFVALRERLINGQDAAFASKINVPVAGRTAALCSSFTIRAQHKFLSVMPLGSETHAHEYRLLFAAPTLDEAALADWWAYACSTVDTLVNPDKTHEFSLISMILVAETVDKAVQKQLKKLSHEIRYSAPQSGWASLRIAVVDLTARRIYTSRMGETLKNILTPFL